MNKRCGAVLVGATPQEFADPTMVVVGWVAVNVGGIGSCAANLVDTKMSWF